MSKHEAWLLCYKSGQMTEAQFQQHLRNKRFADYVNRKGTR
jgi:hypothetical protein